MEQAMKMMRTNISSEWFSHTKASVLALFRWIGGLVRFVLTAMFVPSEADKQIEESRERVRRYLMRS